MGFWIFGTYHLATVKPGVLYRDGVRQVYEFRNTLRKVKPRTVVSLIEPVEMEDPKHPGLLAEKKMLAERGIKLIEIPVLLGGWPTDDQIREFLDIVNDPANQPVLVHCQQGMRRTGMMCSAYRMSVMGMTAEQASDELERFGRGPKSRSLSDILKFIQAYDPKTRGMKEVVTPDQSLAPDWHGGW